MNIPSYSISNNLRTALVVQGRAKLAHQVLYLQGEFPPADTSVNAAGRALCMKLAVDLVNHIQVMDGVAAYKSLKREGT